MDYKSARIYQIRKTIDDDVYVGSTCQPLSKRMAYHRGSMNETAKQHRPLYVKMKEYGVDCFYIELIEECPCENKEQLRKREGHFIRRLGTLNMIQAGRTKKEWTTDNNGHVQENAHKYYEQNKEKHTQQSKEYYETHKEQIKQYNKEYHDKHKEETAAQQKQHYVENKEKHAQQSKEYYEAHKEQMQAYIKQYREENKDKINERKKLRFECPCGGHYRYGDKSKHVNTLLHKTHEATLSL